MLVGWMAATIRNRGVLGKSTKAKRVGSPVEGADNTSVEDSPGGIVGRSGAVRFGSLGFRAHQSGRQYRGLVGLRAVAWGTPVVGVVGIRLDQTALAGTVPDAAMLLATAVVFVSLLARLVAHGRFKIIERLVRAV